MRKIKIIITLSLVWLTGIGYLVWINGLRGPNRLKGFNWDEWFWFGLVPVVLGYVLFVVWKPEKAAEVFHCIKSVFRKKNEDDPK
jgi:hypothetical protein